MSPSEYSIRPFVDVDFDAEARIDREIDPAHAPTVEELRHWDEILNLERGRTNIRLAAEMQSTGEVVGYGSLAQPAFNYDPRRFWIWVAVAPGHRRRGIGAELYSRLEGEARARRGLGLWSDAREEDLAGVQFLDRQGFQIRRKIWLSRVDLATMDLSAIPDRSASLTRDGFRLSTLAEEGATSTEVRQSLYGLSQRSAADIPRLGAFHALSFEEFVALHFESPGFMAEGTFLACKGREIVGMSSLERELARPDTVHIGYTGTLPECRGRGIGTELKRRASLFARQEGFRFLVTGNDSMNRPILAINQRFGFRPETVWIQGEKPLGNLTAPG
ncbi:MAG: N-acetyltransferase family protein [Thermoplasmata archaeon]